MIRHNLTIILKKIFFSGSFLGFYVIFSVFIHELSHVLVALMYGNEFRGLIFEVGDSFFDTIVAVNIVIKNYSSIFQIAIAGCIGELFLGTICMFIAYKKTNLTLFASSVVSICGSLFIWGVSPLISHGDAFMLYNYLGLENIEVLGYIFIFISLFIAVIFIFLFDRMAVIKYDKKGWF